MISKPKFLQFMHILEKWYEAHNINMYISKKKNILKAKTKLNPFESHMNMMERLHFHKRSKLPTCNAEGTTGATIFHSKRFKNSRAIATSPTRRGISNEISIFSIQRFQLLSNDTWFPTKRHPQTLKIHLTQSVHHLILSMISEMTLSMSSAFIGANGRFISCKLKTCR